jgi:hypothetical protein
MTTYVPEDMTEVRLCLGRSGDVSRFAESVPVVIAPGALLPPIVRTVGDLRKLATWPRGHRLVIERDPRPQVRIELP